MTWSISIPHRSRQDSLVDVAAHCRHLPGQDEDRAAARQLVISARLDHGFTSAGELLDHVEALEPAQRRQLLDRARSEVGLPSTETVDAMRRIQSATKPFGLITCAAEGCAATPTRLGIFYDPGVQRWRCPQHIGEALPGDMEPRRLHLRRTPSGAIVEVDPADDQRERTRAESHRAERAARDAEAQAEAVEMRRHEQARRAQIESELPAQMRGFR